MARAEQQGAYGAAYLQALLAPAAVPIAAAPGPPAGRLADAPTQVEIDRALGSCEAYVQVSQARP